MTEKFVVRHKNYDKKADTHTIITLRMERDIQQAFDELAGKSAHSRNELMCMALRYALAHLEFVPEEAEKK